MKICIVGAGFTGLAAAVELLAHGHQVDIFEREPQAGGLAIGFKDPSWDWSLEKHYHHLFTSDTSILDLCKKVGHEVDFYRPKTSTYYMGKIYQLDSPLSLLRFPAIPLIDRLRTGVCLAFLKLNPFWQPLEKITARKFLVSAMGKKSWTVIWEPLFTGKFGEYSDTISAAWFWARIFKRSPSLGYPRGGFQSLADSIAEHITSQGGKIHLGASVSGIVQKGLKVVVKLEGSNSLSFDQLLCTLPTGLFARLVEGLPDNYSKKLKSPKALGAVNLVLALKQSYFTEGTYWLNVNDRSMPYLAVVEHTNLVSKSHYGGDYLLYIGNYVAQGHPYFSKSESDLIKLFTPHLKKINPDFSSSWINKSWVWKTDFAQPIVGLNHSVNILPFDTPKSGIFISNMQQVYPWDRGTNYAVEQGTRVARHMVTKATRWT